MRTDSTRVSGEALQAVRQFIGGTYGTDYLPENPHKYKSPKGAQEAHEAIRPTGVSRRPQDLKRFLSRDELVLYDLIWRRFVASQMTPAIYQVTTVDVKAGDYLFRATASVLQFPGYTAVYQEFREVEEEEAAAKLPPLKEGELLELRDFDPQQHFTKPPPRFTEASLIKELEVQGIGRPSTYATILSNLQDRFYVVKEKATLRPTEMGLVVSDLLVENFPNILDLKFTASMETDLDQVAEGRVSWRQVMRDFYEPFARDLEAARGGMRQVKSVPTGLKCPACGAELVVRWGKNREFLGCSAYPKCSFTSNFIHGPQGRIVIDQPKESGSGGVGGAGASGIKCPLCQKELLVRRVRQVRRGMKGEFLGCSGFPKCKFTQNFSRNEQGTIIPLAKKDSPTKKVEPAVAIDYPCPKFGCGGHLVQNVEARQDFYKCSNSPKCQITFKQKPIAQPCPRCAFPWLMKKGRKLFCPREACDYQAAAVDNNESRLEK
jgi:DNA topoisomerase-1